MCGEGDHQLDRVVFGVTECDRLTEQHEGELCAMHEVARSSVGERNSRGDDRIGAFAFDHLDHRAAIGVIHGA